MNPSPDLKARVVRLPATLLDLTQLSTLLQRMERGRTAPDPDQYRQLVDRIGAELERQAENPGLRELLDCFPATAELYENRQYAVAGLCRSPLALLAEAEQSTRLLLRRLAGEAGELGD